MVSPTPSMIERAGFVLRDYQRAYLADQSRLKIVLKSRQIGFSEVLVIEGVLEAATIPGRNCYYVSTNFKKAKDLIRKCKRWIEAIILADPALAPYLRLVKDNEDVIQLSNGSRLIALPCKPSSVRGETGTIRLDEPAHYQQDYEIYKAIAPAITSNPGLRLILSTTPLGDKGLFHDIYTGKLGGDWSRHKVDVYDAVADGFPASVLDLRESYTEDGWQQEFECLFVADTDRYFHNALLKRSFTDPAYWPLRFTGKVYLGIDVAAKKDRSVAVELLEYNQNFYVIGYRTLSRSGDTMSYPEQFEVLKAQIDENNYAGVAVDATGDGAGLASFLRAEFGGGFVKEVRFTAPWNEKHIPGLKRDMESGRFHMPDDSALISAFGKIKRQTTMNNNTTFKADRDGDGHADEFYAVVLAYSLAKVFPVPATRSEIEVVSAVGSMARELMKY